MGRRRSARRSEFAEYGDELSVHRRCPVTECLDWVSFSESVETCEQANALTAGEFGLGRAPAEEQAIQLTVAEELRNAAATVASRYGAVAAGAWARTGRRSDGAVFTIGSLARYHLHDVEHHLHDVSGTR